MNIPMKRLEVRHTDLFETVVYQPGNGTRYDLLIGTHTYSGQRVLTMVWLNTTRQNNTITLPRHQLTRNELIFRLGCGPADGEALAVLANEYMDKAERATTLRILRTDFTASLNLYTTLADKSGVSISLDEEIATCIVEWKGQAFYEVPFESDGIYICFDPNKEKLPTELLALLP